MKITNSEIIKTGERELIDTIIGDLDWGTIEKIIRDRHHLNIQDDIEYKDGDIIVHENKVAYRLDFEVKMTLSVVFDREGTCLSLRAAEDTDPLPAASDAIDRSGEDADMRKAMANLSIPESGAEPRQGLEDDILELTSEIDDRPEIGDNRIKVAESGASTGEGDDSEMEKEMADLLDSTLDIESEQALEDDILQLTSELDHLSEDSGHEASPNVTSNSIEIEDKLTQKTLPAETSLKSTFNSAGLPLEDELAEFDAEPDHFSADTIEELTVSDLVENERHKMDVTSSAANQPVAGAAFQSEKAPQEKMSKMASQIADLISEINED